MVCNAKRRFKLADQKQNHPATTDADHSAVKSNSGDGDPQGFEANQGKQGTPESTKGYQSDQADYRRNPENQSTENKPEYSGSGDNHWEVQRSVEGSSTNEAYEGYKSSHPDIGGFSSETGTYRGHYGAREDSTDDVQRDPSQGGPYEGQIDHVREQNNGPKERPGDSDGGSRT